ncbi:hypothetical protein Tco_0628983 [Tanacetum coccineum]|uniref:Retroviral polymerase SH3-like domain-containing protein n=1 Tax=Tanacetum coccineum TaxID=301880 RepID=A0ABQ4WSL8_9ASTR
MSMSSLKRASGHRKVEHKLMTQSASTAAKPCQGDSFEYYLITGYSQTSKAYIVLNKKIIRIEESLNVTFDESFPEPKSSPSIEDDRINDPVFQDLNWSSSLQVNVSDEGYPKSLKEARAEVLDLQLVLLCRDKNKVCLLCEEILKQIPAFDFFCASLESISAIEDTWERWEVWEDIQVVPGFLMGRERWLYG